MRPTAKRETSRLRFTLVGVVLLCLPPGLSACGDDAAVGVSGYTVRREAGDTTSFGADSVVVVTEDETYVVTGEGDCVEIEGKCYDIAAEQGRYCNSENAQADVIIEDGEIVEVICYPDPDEGIPIEDAAINTEGNVELPQNRSGLVITFDETTDGVAVENDVALEGERLVIFGNGIDETIFGQNLNVASNNSRVRGITVEGNVTYDRNSNNSALSFVKIYGNLTVESNGFIANHVIVFGDVQINGNGAHLFNMLVQGTWDPGNPEECADNFAFEDVDNDHNVDVPEDGTTAGSGEGTGNTSATEVRDALTCN